MTELSNYLSKVPGATEGNRNAELNGLAYRVLETFAPGRNDFEYHMQKWAASCSPPMNVTEALKTLTSAWNGAAGKGVIGSKKRAQTRNWNAPARPQPEPEEPATVAFQLAEESSEFLPAPMADGARELLKTAFKKGEGVRISFADLNEERREIPGRGVVLSREEWLSKLGDSGDIHRIYKPHNHEGCYISVNPMQLGGSKDADVTAFRHALIEFDEISIAEQYQIFKQSRLPIAAIIHSGGKSVHAWVKVDAKNRQEFTDRVRTLHEYLAQYSPDPANKNPSRYSRLPNCRRFDSRQELHELNVGAATWSDWEKENSYADLGDDDNIDTLDAFDPSIDGQTVLGNRWICQSGSAVVVGPSGVGKSSLMMQMATQWAMGDACFGIKPAKPLRIILVQAENDKGDLMEMSKGVRDGLNLDEFDDVRMERLRKNLTFQTDTARTGKAFISALQRRIERAGNVDLIILDPLLSFIGADISKQEVCSQFLRNWLNPILKSSKAAVIMAHHTGKPPNDKKTARSGWQSSDYSYAGLGSSELTNWARATCTIEQHGHGEFSLRLAKRGKRAGATNLDGSPTEQIWLRHAETGIHWRQVDAPAEPEQEAKTDHAAAIEKMGIRNDIHAQLVEGVHYTATELKERIGAWGEEHKTQVPRAQNRRSLIDRWASKAEGAIQILETIKPKRDGGHVKWRKKI